MDSIKKPSECTLHQNIEALLRTRMTASAVARRLGAEAEARARRTAEGNSRARRLLERIAEDVEAASMGLSGSWQTKADSHGKRFY